MSWAAVLLPLAGLWFLAAAMPGPNTLLVGHRAARDGWTAAAVAACGTATGTLVWATAALFGLTLLFAAAPHAQTAIRVAGGLYLVWTGITMWRAAGSAGGVADDRPSLLGAYRAGLLANLSNPKSAAFATSLLAASLPAGAPAGLRVAAVATVVATSLFWYLAVGISPSHARSRIRASAPSICAPGGRSGASPAASSCCRV